MREAHLRDCADRGLRPNTLAAKRGALRRFERALAPTLPQDATAEQVKCWYMTVGGLAQHRHCELSHIRVFFKYLHREGYRDDDPTVRLLAPKLHRRMPRPASDADVRAAVEGAPEPVLTWILFEALAGLRSCEVAPLHRDDLHLELATPMLHVREGKGGHARVVPLHPRLAALPLADSGYLWPEGRTHVTARHVMTSINYYLRKLGIRATGHQLRAFFGCRYYEASGFDIRSTQEVLGHQSPVHTALYTSWSKAAAGVAVAQIEI